MAQVQRHQRRQRRRGATGSGDAADGVAVSQISDRGGQRCHRRACRGLPGARIVLVVSFISIGWRAGLVVAITIPWSRGDLRSCSRSASLSVSLGALIIASASWSTTR
jgi:hypothetical protein